MTKSEHHFQTTALQANLRQRSLQSGTIALLAQPIKLAVGIGATMVLARLLTPADFGLLAMVQPLLDLVDSVSNLGLETATVQHEELDQEKANAIFWLSLKINALIVVGMVLCGPLLAWFYDAEELVGIVPVMALGVISLCVSFQQMSLLKRQMRFGLLTLIDVVAVVISAGAAIVMALAGRGYWALVCQIVVMQIIRGVAYWLFCNWRPHWPIPGKKATPEVRSLLTYGANLSGFRLISRIGMQMDRVLLGYFSGSSALGLYSMAYQWAYFPFRQIYFPLFDVAVSSLSRSYADPERYRLYCRKGLMPVFAVCLPALAYLFINAADVVLLLLGEQWLEAIPLFRVLAIAVFVGTLYRMTKWIYVSAGATQQQLRWSFIHTPVMIMAVAIGVQWGAYGVAVGYTVGICLLAYPSVVFCVRSTPLTLGDYWSAVWRAALSSVVAAALLYQLQPLLPGVATLAVSLVLKFLIFTLLYVSVWMVLPGGFSELKSFAALFGKGKNG